MPFRHGGFRHRRSQADLLSLELVEPLEIRIHARKSCDRLIQFAGPVHIIMGELEPFGYLLAVAYRKSPGALERPARTVQIAIGLLHGLTRPEAVSKLFRLVKFRRGFSDVVKRVHIYAGERKVWIRRTRQKRFSHPEIVDAERGSGRIRILN